MRKSILATGALTVVGLAVAVFVFGSREAKATDADGDGRYQTATWITGSTDPQFHLTPNHLHAVAGTSLSVDCQIEIELMDSNSVVLGKFLIQGSNGADGGYAEWKDGLAGYASNSTFTITARYKALNGTLNDTESISFTKP